MSTPVEIAAQRLENADAAWEAAQRVGLPFAVACALLDMESEGRNIYGHDAGGVFSVPGKDIPVTEENYAQFREAIAQGAKSNGVGPCQITYKGFFPQADAQGLELWRPVDNCVFGFGLIKGYLAKRTAAEAGTLYNAGNLNGGVTDYGRTFARKVDEWTERLDGATDEPEEAPVSGNDWYGKAIKREIKPGSNDPEIRPIGVILHVDAGNAGGEALFNYFKDRSGGIESHFHIQKDGKVYQYRAVGREADANYKGNSFVNTNTGERLGYISVETQGLEDGTWTKAQLAAIKALLEWARDEHGIPLEVPPTPKSPGVGYHVLFGAPGAWTPVAKSCPGPKRIKQFREELVPWMAGEASSPDDTDTPKPVEPQAPAWVSIKPGQRHANVKLLQQWLIKAGYGPISGAVTTYYGRNTQAAVARFHNANPHLKASGVSYDPAIGPRGWQELYREAN